MVAVSATALGPCSNGPDMCEGRILKEAEDGFRKAGLVEGERPLWAIKHLERACPTKARNQMLEAGMSDPRNRPAFSFDFFKTDVGPIGRISCTP